jgi:RNase P/RNase MRP subunit p30
VAIVTGIIKRANLGKEKSAFILQYKELQAEVKNVETIRLNVNSLITAEQPKQKRSTISKSKKFFYIHCDMAE